MRKTLTLAAFLIPAVLCAEDSSLGRLTKATEVLREIRATPDQGIPQDLLEKAQCIVVVPGLKKIAFIGGGKFGRGYASCLTGHGWSSPAGVRIEGGSFGLQLGASSTDVIMLVMNTGGMAKLMSDKFTIGGDASAAAGPVGRTLTANTDVLMKAEILSYSRSHGLFAGLSLDGATLRPDGDANRELYGGELNNDAILRGEGKRLPASGPFLAQLQRFSGKGAPPAPRKRASTSQPPSGAVSNGTTDTGGLRSDNTKTNQADRNADTPTADNSKNNKSDLEIAREIRRSIVTDKSLSTYGHNVKVIVQHGKVTLRGPVHSDDEKTNVAGKATAIAGEGNVVNNITVTSDKQ